mmetsp:Transcript_15963/g.46563  ORF Transcript_15963/g.46563 Transcript_15963/m.46563 type:complete len:218 (+) Transcript_15963:873-1526(+)
MRGMSFARGAGGDEGSGTCTAAPSSAGGASAHGAAAVRPRSARSMLSSPKQRSKLCVSTTAKGADSTTSATSERRIASRRPELGPAPGDGGGRRQPRSTEPPPSTPSTSARTPRRIAWNSAVVRGRVRGMGLTRVRTARSTAARSWARPSPRTRWSAAESRRSCVVVGSPTPLPPPAAAASAPTFAATASAPARASIRWRATRFARTRMSRWVRTRA